MRNASLPSFELAAQYDWCRRICRQSQSSFYSSFRLLTPPRRRAMYALYAFARITDDLGDSDAPSDVRRARLDAWETQLAAVMPPDSRQLAESPTLEPLKHIEQFSPLWPALADTVQAFQLPPQLLFDIVRGVRLDLDFRPPVNWDELKHYCYHVASAVGLACVHIWRKEVEIPTQCTIDCGIAFQLTNILRDVAEDARCGRLYLPISEMEQFGVDPARWLAGEPDGDWHRMIDQVAHTAEQLYLNGWQTIFTLTPDSQRMFSLMWRSYRELLTQVVNNKHSLWTAPKVRLSTKTKLSLLTNHLVPQLFRRLPPP